MIYWDATVKGCIEGNGTEASIKANVACDNSIPKGEVSGTVKFFDGKGTKKVSFCGKKACKVITNKTKSLQSVGAVFTNVKVCDVTNKKVWKDCTVYLTATRLTSGTWSGSFEIVCRCHNIFIYGVFDGSVSVNRQVFCEPLL